MAQTDRRMVTISVESYEALSKFVEEKKRKGIPATMCGELSRLALEAASGKRDQ